MIALTPAPLPITGEGHDISVKAKVFTKNFRSRIDFGSFFTKPKSNISLPLETASTAPSKNPAGWGI